MLFKLPSQSELEEVIRSTIKEESLADWLVKWFDKRDPEKTLHEGDLVMSLINAFIMFIPRFIGDRVRMDLANIMMAHYGPTLALALAPQEAHTAIGRYLAHKDAMRFH